MSPFLVQVQDLDEICLLAGDLLVADGIGVQLVPGDLLGLHTVAGFEVDDRCLVRVEPSDLVDPAVNRNAGCYVNLDLRVYLPLSVRHVDHLIAAVTMALNDRAAWSGRRPATPSQVAARAA